MSLKYTFFFKLMTIPGPTRIALDALDELCPSAPFFKDLHQTPEGAELEARYKAETEDLPAQRILEGIRKIRLAQAMDWLAYCRNEGIISREEEQVYIKSLRLAYLRVGALYREENNGPV